MNRMHSSLLAAVFLPAAALGLPAAAGAADETTAESDSGVTIQEWTVPWPNTRPRDPAVAPDGRIWLVGQAGDYAALFDPDSEEFTRHDLPEGAGPHTIYVTAAGEAWYAGNKDRHLGRIDPDSGEIERVNLPGDTLADPHTISEDSQGRLWFTSQHANHIGRYDPDSGEVEAVEVPTEGARPYGIEVADDDRVWVVLLGTNKLAGVDPESMELTEYEVPREDARLRRIAITGEGIWYGDYARGYIGVFDPETGEFREWRAPRQARSGPYALMDDGQGRIWFFETIEQPNRLVGFDPDSEEFFSITEVPSGGGTVRHMVFDAERNSLWFGTDTNNLGRAGLPD